MNFLYKIIRKFISNNYHEHILKNMPIHSSMVINKKISLEAMLDASLQRESFLYQCDLL